MEEPERRIRSYSRRSGRLSSSQERALAELLPRYGGTLSIERPLPLSQWFPEYGRIVLEIGFGMGEATVEIAEKFPDHFFLGAEVHKPGIGRLLNEIERRGIKNIRVVHGDADILIRTMLPKLYLSGVHIFFSDPWPKKRHHKRRLIQAPFLRSLLPVLKPDGYIYMVTDWEDYAQWILAESEKVPELENPYKGYASPIPWRPETRFEKKGLDKMHLIREIWLQKR